VAPGGIASAFGASMGGAGVGASAVPLPTDVSHSTVTVTQGSTVTKSPVFYESTGQVNFQIPFTLIAGTAAQLIVSVAGVASPAITFTPAAVAPGVFVVVHGLTNAPVTAASPAAPGEVLTIYCSGLGAVTPTVASGAASPTPAATTNAMPTVSIGGMSAPQQFSGLTPTLVGLYQVNAVTPSGLPSGTQALTVTILGSTSNSVTTYVQ
jgi:uncharacterized protein (TIGR03437 family)